MVFVRRPTAFFVQRVKACSTTSFTICNWRSLCAMKEVQINGSSDPSTCFDDSLPVLPPVTVSKDHQYSSGKVKATPEIEKKYVHRVYDAIAPHFSSTRFAKWPKVQMFLSSLSRGSLILDAGCGNGKYLGLNPNSYFIGCDISGPLINICADKGHEVLVADAVNLPYRNGYGDAVISIAVLHHLSTESRRKKAMDELVRVVKTGGLVLITVWAREQEDNKLVNKWTPLTDKYLEEWVGPGSPRNPTPSSSSSSSLKSIPEAEENGCGEILLSSSKNEDHLVDCKTEKTSLYQQEYFVPWHLPYHRAEVNGVSANAVAKGFARKDDKKSAVVYDRYYHVFGEGELERLANGVEGAVIVDRFYDKSNWCIILQKTAA